VVFALGVTFELRAVVVDFAQVAGGVAFGLIVKVRGREMTIPKSEIEGSLAGFERAMQAVCVGAMG
jgi:hypothetical protein